jgi:hypothetical protein
MQRPDPARMCDVWRRDSSPPFTQSTEPEPNELLASGQVPSGQLFEKVLEDRDRLLAQIAAERAEKHEFEEALHRSHQMVGQLQAEIERLTAPTRRPAT